MTECETQLAELQNLCMRTLEILNEEKFFDKTSTTDGCHSSLHIDLINASNGKQFKFFTELMKHLPRTQND